MTDRHMTYISDHAPAPPPLHDDILRGAAEIAEFIYGDPAKRRSRRGGGRNVRAA